MYHQSHVTANKEGGLTVMGIDKKDNLLVIVVKPNDSTENWRIDEIRDQMSERGIENAIAWDGSTSSTLVVDSEVLSKPSSKINNTIPFGIGLRSEEPLITRHR